MQASDLKVFDRVPFFFWIKDEQGKYVWANQALKQLAQVEVVGKTDHELPWSGSADALLAADKRVFETGEPLYVHEKVETANLGGRMHSVCKWLDQFNGKKHCYGIAFVV